MREFRLDFVNTYTMLRDTLRNLWVIILSAVIGFLGVRAYYDFTYVPEYTCSATVSVGSSATGVNALTNLNKAIETASTFREMFQSSYFKEKLADLTGEAVTGDISASQISETNLLTVSYTCSAPVSAYKTLVGVLRYYNEITDYSFSDIILNVIIEPKVPVSVSNPVSYAYRDVFAALALSALSLALTLVASYFRDTLKNESDINEMLDTKLLSVIYHENKNKTLKAKLGFVHSKDPLLITNILINYRFTEAYRIAALKTEYLINAKSIKTLMITSCRENEGKSTASVNLALSLAKLGKQVLLIDADLRKPAIYKFFGGILGEEKPNGLGEVLSGSVSINEAIIKDKETGLYLMVGSRNFSDSSEMLSAKRFERLLASLSEQFDLILLDTAPTSLVSDAEIISANVDAAFIVARFDITPVPEINDMIELLADSGAAVEGCIFNDVHVLPSIFRHDAADSAEERGAAEEVSKK